mmetsp:Transcript_21961/g.52274  ORF Transcript_21961/g.52274 Transcript_21961/m.52274 type:complete len:202 (+) Transcript_21961:164-769(+)
MEPFVYVRRRCNGRHQPSANAGFLLVLLLSLLTVSVDSQTDMLNHCGSKPCIEPLRISCEKVMELYQFQGSCCSLDIIPSTGGCRVTVSYGNCFWYPWCGICDEEDEKVSRCNNHFQTAANIRPCPEGDYDPVAIQASENFTVPSCSPSMQPSAGFLSDESTAAAPTSVVVVRKQQWWVRAATTGAVAAIVTAIAAAVAAA